MSSSNPLTSMVTSRPPKISRETPDVYSFNKYTESFHSRYLIDHFYLSKRMATTQHFDNHGRPITYLRLAVSDHCNLRCFYCMPEDGIKYLVKKELLTFEEIERVINLTVSVGIPTVRQPKNGFEAEERRESGAAVMESISTIAG